MVVDESDQVIKRLLNQILASDLDIDFMVQD